MKNMMTHGEFRTLNSKKVAEILKKFGYIIITGNKYFDPVVIRARV